MTSDARAKELIEGYFKTEWPRVCPDATFSVGGAPAPQDEVFVHLEVWSGVNRKRLQAGRVGWIYVRCWVPLVLQVTATVQLHRAAREIFEGTVIASDDGRLVIDEGERMDIGREHRWWLSVASFPFRFVSDSG